MRAAIRVAQLPALLTVVLVVLLIVLPGRTELVLHVYALAIAAIALLHLVHAVRTAHPVLAGSPFEAALRKRTRRRDERLPELARVEREVSLGMATAFDLHYRLRPPLRRIAGELLAAHRGIDLDGNPDGARKALGDETWEIVRADREPPQDRYGTGLPLATLHAVVKSLEAL
jgi:hypothetical protein